MAIISDVLEQEWCRCYTKCFGSCRNVESSRKYPVDIVYPKSKGYSNEIIIPDNYKIEKLPEEYFFNNKIFFLQYKVTSNNGLIKINAVYQFKKAVYQPEEYLKIKRYFSLIIKHFNQKIVLVKN